MALLIGEFETTIDAKHRVAINSSFREQIDPEEDGQEFVLLLGPDRHLWLYPDKYYRRLLASVRRSPLPDRLSRKIDLFFGMARLLKADAQGRVVLPEKSMKRAIVSSAVTLVGVDDHIEVWPAEDWDRHVEEMLPSYGELLYEAAERLKAENGQMLHKTE